MLRQFLSCRVSTHSTNKNQLSMHIVNLSPRQRALSDSDTYLFCEIAAYFVSPFLWPILKKSSTDLTGHGKLNGKFMGNWVWCIMEGECIAILATMEMRCWSSLRERYLSKSTIGVISAVIWKQLRLFFSSPCCLYRLTSLCT